jgi:hypothetical protein
MSFDYKASAEFFAGRSQRGPRPMMYRRFTRAADALRYAIEELPAANFLGAILDVDGKRYRHDTMRELYNAPEYPLKRMKIPKKPQAKIEAKQPVHGKEKERVGAD